MRWCLLGPVEATVSGRPLAIRRPQHRGLLALLLLNANHVVSVPQIERALWGDRPPASARTQVQVCVSQLRAALRTTDAAHLLAHRAGGYRLTVAAHDLDLAEFTAAVDRARIAARHGRPAEAAGHLRAGLTLWRGPALAGAAGAFVPAAAAELTEQRLAAYEQLAEVELALGRHERLLDTLRPLLADHPLRERLVARYMLALAGSGQQEPALRLYDVTRSRLAEELGIEPCAELASAHLRVLRHEVPAAAPAVPSASPAAGHAPTGVGAPAGAGGAVVPAQLPADVAGFTGRAAPLRQLDALLPEAPAGAGTPAPVVISAIGGTAGVGKTALAVHWAHRVAHRFPDGQLYVNLRGFDLDGRAVAPGEALRDFLDSLRVPPHQVPAEESRQAALYRTLLAGRRMLILLDNARDADQVRALLPGAPGCLVVVTSRDRLVPLLVAEGARPLTLDLLSTAEARQFLGRRIGPARLATEPEAVDEIVERCARLPLALAVVGARAAVHPGFPLAALAGELRDAPDGLAAFDDADPATGVRAVLSWSYRALGAAEARLFRLLGLHPGPDVALPAAASLAGLPVSRVRPLLAGLTRAHLLAEHEPGRYTFHDLLRAYAVELCRRDDADPERAAARHRMYDHYLHSAHAADHLLDPHRLTPRVRLTPTRPDATVQEPAGHAGAMAWFTAEHRVLLAAVAQAATTGFDGHAWRLAAVVTTFLDRQGHWGDLAGAQHLALAAARRQADRTGQAQAHRGLAVAYTWLGRHDEAHRHYQRDLDLYAELDDRAGQAHTHVGISWLLARQGRHRTALEHAERALLLYRATASTVGQAKTLNNIGWLHGRLGDHHRAAACCQAALALHARNDDRRGAALTWDSLGYAHHRLGQHDRAVECYHRALDLHRELGDRYDEGEVLANLGDAHHAAGDCAAARTAWRQALEIYDELQHPDADQLRGRIAEPDRVPAGGTTRASG
ncbi:BTAD domain-containing putative transcriptional regulator [Plantactinospora mayteni]|uniref:SARP family transcriptional regulator n=1 Tax=Plantactinospora mayteni TaxID=566021 RepID=A0ABQ4EMN3_9ACTN|nr:AfsR/SARP family transcriptional regulator [Plantactinospora mayteni]GIG95910.1 SARP family transcriptional regulator [Plantactinospora mayteni]